MPFTFLNFNVTVAFLAFFLTLLAFKDLIFVAFTVLSFLIVALTEASVTPALVVANILTFPVKGMLNVAAFGFEASLAPLVLTIALGNCTVMLV